jgi:polyisoprenoid-binding protein YceI
MRRLSKQFVWALGLWAVFQLGLSPVLAREYDVNLKAKRDARFRSTTDVNEFEGVTDHIDGYVLLPDSAPPLTEDAKGSQMHFEVELASLDTGIGLRNRHMRDNYLQVEKYPYAIFNGSIAQVESAGGDTLRVTAKGIMEIHGKKKEMSIPCTVNPENSGYRVHGAFTVLLSDFDISIPKIMFLQLDNEIHLQVDFAVEPIKN